MAALLSIRESTGKLEILNQLLLPHVSEYIPIDSIEAAHEAIKSMKIRGAPAIASLAALSVAHHLTNALIASPTPDFMASAQSLADHLTAVLDFLYTSRPTAVNLGHAVRRIKATLAQSVQSGGSTAQIAQDVIAVSRLVHEEDLERNKNMSKNGANWLIEELKKSGKTTEKGINILTVCNTGSLATSGYGTALGLITRLHETGQLGKAYYTQTAPYHQGSRLTSLELQTLKIPSVMICDTMVGSLFQHHTIHAVAVGADRIAKNGDTANKIGTYNAAVLAKRHKIPFIVVAPISTVDLAIEDGSYIPIEQRPAIEACLVRGIPYPPSGQGAKLEQTLVQITPTGIDLDHGVYNPSFDVTPVELITAVVTEKGVAVRSETQDVFDLSAVV